MFNEDANTVHGRLLESVHITGYSFERACAELEWLLEEDRWKKVGGGFDRVDNFLETLNFSEFKIAVEKRKKLAKKLAKLQATQRATAKALGVDHKTINRDLGENAPKPEKKTKETPVVAEQLGENSPPPPEPAGVSLGGGEAAQISIKQKEKQQKKERRQKELAEQRNELASRAEQLGQNERFLIECADIESWRAANEYDFIITDPPYKKEFLYLYEILGARANEWLKDGGLLIVMCGQSYLDEIYKSMSRNLAYYWTASYLTPGQPTPLRKINVNTTWKPLLIYTKGDYTGKTFGDVFKSDQNDKSFHEWGQSESGMLDIISKVCFPGQHILDPFLGAGTTGVAAIKHGCLFDGIDKDEESVNISKSRIAGIL